MKIKKYIKKQMKKLETCITYDVLEALQKRESILRVYGDTNKKSLSKYELLEVDDHGSLNEFTAEKQDLNCLTYEYQFCPDDVNLTNYETELLKTHSGKKICDLHVDESTKTDKYDIFLQDGTQITCSINCIRMV